jgi:hypothetical protein
MASQVPVRIAAALPVKTQAQILTNARRARAVEPPHIYRQANDSAGSCAWASTATLLHWQGQHDQARLLRATHAGGAGPGNLYPAFDRAGLDYAAIPDAQHAAGDAEFLRWCCRTRRGACVPVGAWCDVHRTRHPCQHVLVLTAIDDRTVSLIDNNGPRTTYTRDAADFLGDWRESGGWAFTPLYSPAPPQPWIFTPETEKPQ